MQQPEGAMTLDEIAELASRGIHVTFEVLDAIEVGLWCNKCLLPSKCVFPVRGISTEAVYDLGVVYGCDEHGLDCS